MVDKFQRYRDAANDGLAELGKLTAQKREIESEILRLTNLIAANIAMLPSLERSDLGIKLETMKSPVGLSDAVLRMLSFTNYMSVAEVRDALINSGYDLSGQVNALASINTTLRRLAADDNLKRVISKEEDMRTVYKRVRPKSLYPPGRNAMSDVIDEAVAAMQKKK